MPSPKTPTPLMRALPLALATLLGAALALAATAPARAQDVQLYHPATGAHGDLGVEGTRTAGEGILVPALHVHPRRRPTRHPRSLR